MPEDSDRCPALALRSRRYPATATTRLKQAEAAQLRAAADRLDLTVSMLLRNLTLAYLADAA